MKSRVLAAILFLAPLSANAITLLWPAQCTLGKDCFVQNYVDHDPTPEAHDFTCNSLTYDGHDGTDIRLRSLAAMRAGVNVVAVADGTVLGARDGIEDRSIRDADGHLTEIHDHNCGNGVNIQHAEGYHTQVCHMMKGSIRVKTGQQVKAGDVLGQIGLSGQTEFPHVHLSVWKDDVIVDPFNNQTITTACDPKNVSFPTSSLWKTPAPYLSSILLNDGFTDATPDKEVLRDTPVNRTHIATNAPVISYWTDIIGIHKDDILTLRILAPDGQVFAEETKNLEKPYALYFTYIGKRLNGSWMSGEYKATVTLSRPQFATVTTPLPNAQNQQSIGSKISDALASSSVLEEPITENRTIVGKTVIFTTTRTMTVQ